MSKNMPPVHPCVSFLFIDQDKVLLEQRSKEKSCDPDMVAIPGGHMETGESQTETLLREIREEGGVRPCGGVALARCCKSAGRTR
ncbi:NUDIX hydrolase, partial [Vibrio vulnificus]|uniref:NUDIX hydrolase n=1 Tax=Vibrio vulnificus TaxID=672 RepID=UPI001EE9B47D